MLPLWFGLALSLMLLLLTCRPTRAEKIDDLKPGRTYQVGKISITGNHAFSDSRLLAQMKTKMRPIYQSYQFWKKRPEFDSDVFTADLQRIRQFYVAHGYFQAKVEYNLSTSQEVVNASIQVTENPPVTVQSLQIQVDNAVLPPEQPIYRSIKLKPGVIFDQTEYHRAEDVLREHFLDTGHAHVTVDRRAHVNLAQNQARIWYRVHPGVSAVFGNTEIVGADHVAAEIVSRALTYKPGERFSQQQIEKSRANLLMLGLFALVRFDPQLHTGNPQVVPIKLTLREKPKHQIQVGGGYNTESQFVADFQWSDLNWQGDGRQLSLIADYSSIDSALGASLMQPFLFGLPNATGYLDLREDIQQVPTFTLFATRFLPRFQYAFTPELVAYIGFRLEYAKLTAIDPTVVRALHGFRQSGFLSGPFAGLSMNTSDDPYYPHRGYVLNIDAMQGGAIWGGAFNFYRVEAELKHYEAIGWNTILATRFKVGTGDSLGSKYNYPLFYRFYAGGEGSVRGYGYWLLGPQSSDHTPLGGLSDIEGSFELRHPIWQQIGGALFLDFGQLSLRPYDLPISNLDFAAGPAVSYTTPVGPLRIDLGIPFKKPPGQQAWQVYFSIGQFF